MAIKYFTLSSAIAFLLLSLGSSAPKATSCSLLIPSGAVITPACTWIVVQYDPGVFKDNVGDYWVPAPCVNGVCSPVPVKVALSALHIGG